ncbi:hydrogenase maturation peptidase HycI [candidate division FCPU426 bacterium]|nr:hydrogenase maturation peptidase HycI [candidate division FCPU426 bacterium]
MSHKRILMGVGNSLRADDGVGSYIAAAFADPDWLAIDCGTVPENFTAEVKKHQPETLVLVDAAQMQLPAGTVRLIPKEKIEDLGLGTHALPLSLLMEYLQPFVKKDIVFIGIQPKQVQDGECLSQEVMTAARQVILVLHKAAWDQVQSL